MGKAQAAKEKAYHEAVRSQQRQEEINGFRKLPARAPLKVCQPPLPLSHVDPVTDVDWDGTESEDGDGDDPDQAICSYLFVIIQFD